MVAVVLLQRIEKLGQIGDVVTVKPGYARNFLFPRQKALRATEENIAYFEAQKAQIVADNLKMKAEAEKIAERMKGLTLVVIRQAGESGHLYGSVSSKDVSDAVSAEGYKVSRTQVQIDRPIKELGLVKVYVSLHPEVKVEVTLNVAQSPEEAQMQANKAAPKVKEAVAEEAAPVEA